VLREPQAFKEALEQRELLVGKEQLGLLGQVQQAQRV